MQVSFFRKEEGQGMVEYSVLLALITLATFGTVMLLGTSVGTAFSSIIQAI